MTHLVRLFVLMILHWISTMPFSEQRILTTVHKKSGGWTIYIATFLLIERTISTRESPSSGDQDRCMHSFIFFLNFPDFVNQIFRLQMGIIARSLFIRMPDHGSTKPNIESSRLQSSAVIPANDQILIPRRL